MSGTELFYIDKEGKKQDAALHEEMLSRGTSKKILDQSKASARAAGLTEDQIKSLFD